MGPLRRTPCRLQPHGGPSHAPPPAPAPLAGRCTVTATCRRTSCARSGAHVRAECCPLIPASRSASGAAHAAINALNSRAFRWFKSAAAKLASKRALGTLAFLRSAPELLHHPPSVLGQMRPGEPSRWAAHRYAAMLTLEHCALFYVPLIRAFANCLQNNVASWRSTALEESCKSLGHAHAYACPRLCEKQLSRVGFGWKHPQVRKSTFTWCCRG